MKVEIRKRVGLMEGDLVTVELEVDAVADTFTLGTAEGNPPFQIFLVDQMIKYGYNYDIKQ